MDRVQANGVELEFETAGSGETVLLIHGSIVCDTFAPMVGEPALARYRLIRYRRRGYGGRDFEPFPMTVEQHAADAGALLSRLGVEQAHVVGHSYGALVGLQLAVDAPGVVHSIALLESAVAALPASPSSPAIGQALAPVMSAYANGDIEEAVDLLCLAIFGQDYRMVLDGRLPGDAFKLALKDAATTLEGDLGLMGNWEIEPNERAAVAQPVLNIVGAESDGIIKPAFGVDLISESAAIIRGWLPHVEDVVLPGLNHALHAQDSGPVAEALASFFDRHPMS